MKTKRKLGPRCKHFANIVLVFASGRFGGRFRCTGTVGHKHKHNAWLDAKPLRLGVCDFRGVVEW